jgi:hypothetical protein
MLTGFFDLAGIFCLLLFLVFLFESGRWTYSNLGSNVRPVPFQRPRHDFSRPQLGFWKLLADEDQDDWFPVFLTDAGSHHVGQAEQLVPMFLQSAFDFHVPTLRLKMSE